MIAAKTQQRATIAVQTPHGIADMDVRLRCLSDISDLLNFTFSQPVLVAYIHSALGPASVTPRSPGALSSKPDDDE
jgi:hypothetical protein